MPGFNTYIPAEVSVVVGTRPIGGTADGVFARIERANDAFTMREGADGEVTRSKSGSKSGTITITLEQHSDSNAYLSGIAVADELSGGGTVPILVHDVKGGGTFTCAAAWCRKMPDVEYGKEAGTIEWVFDCAQIDYIIGAVA